MHLIFGSSQGSYESACINFPLASKKMCKISCLAGYATDWIKRKKKYRLAIGLPNQKTSEFKLHHYRRVGSVLNSVLGGVLNSVLLVCCDQAAVTMRLSAGLASGKYGLSRCDRLSL